MEFQIKKLNFTWNKIMSSGFFGCIVAGFLTYFYTMTHHFLTYDSMWNLYSKQDMISSGRQFLTFACRISSDYDMPWVNGVLAILYLALASGLIVDIFQVQNKITALLIGAFMVTFPSITATFCYSYTIDGYMLAVLLTTVAFYITRKYKFGVIPAVFLVGFGLGVYQAYFSYLILLCILTLLLDLILEKDMKTIWKWILRYVIMGVGSYAFYVISLKIMLLFSDQTMSGYQGTDKIMSFSLKEIPKGLIASVKSFGSFIVHRGALTSNMFMRVAFYAIVLIGIGGFVYLLWNNRKNLTGIRVAGIVVLIGLIPFATSLISILSPDAFFHLLMRYPWVLFFVFVMVLIEKITKSETGSSTGNSAENTGKKSLNWKQILSCVTLVAGLVMVFEFAVVANIVAFNMNERYEKTYATCLRIADRLEQTPEYKMGDPVAVLGGLPDENYYPKTDITEDYLKGYFGTSGDLCVDSTDKYEAFFMHYLNITINGVDNAKEMELVETSEFKEMETFPKAECIKKIDGVWVIKING